jgi:hypothetical protein
MQTAEGLLGGAHEGESSAAALKSTPRDRRAM